MQIEYVARDFKLDDKIREYSAGKLLRLATFLHEPISAHVTLATEKKGHRADVRVTYRHGTLQAAEQMDTMRSAIDGVSDKLEKQARRASKKQWSTRRRALISPED